MKKIFNRKALVIAALSILTLSSCEREYLDQYPTTSIGYDPATATVDNLANVINGMHRNMYVRQNSSQGQNGGTAVLIYMDILGEDVIFPSTGNGWFVSTLRWQDGNNANSGNLFYPYRFYYSQINNANIVINKAPEAAGDSNLRDRIMGEAYAFRAYSYSMLVQIYGKRYVPGQDNKQLGVPLRLDETINAIPRATVEEVYKQINSDLAKASELLKGKSRLSKSHFNYNVVRGLMARVALTQGKYNEAATYANEARQGFELMTPEVYKKGFNDNQVPEWMWGYDIIETQSDYFGNFMAYMSRNYNSTQIRSAPKVMNSKLYSLFPSTDVRTQVVDPNGDHVGLLSDIDPATGKPKKKSEYANYSLFKYTSQKFTVENLNSSLGDIPFMRAAEMYLIEAEALARAGKEAESKAVFALLESKRNPAYKASANTGAAYITEILNSRRLELWGEGFRFLDLKRLGLPLDRTGTNVVNSVVNNVLTVPADDKKWTWLIPQSEIDNSEGLVVQNEL